MRIAAYSNNILIVKDIMKRFKAESNDVLCHFFSHRSEFISFLTNETFDGIVILDDGESEVEYILRGISALNHLKHVKTILLSSDLVRDGELLSLTPLRISLVSVKSPIESVISELKMAFGKDKIDIDMSFMKVLVDASTGVVEQMSGDKSITHGKPFIFQGEDLNIFVRSVLEFDCALFSGKFYVSFPKMTFEKFCKRVLGDISDEELLGAKDLVQELANIVYGQAKRVVNQQSGTNLGMKIPALCEALPSSKFPIVAIPYETAFGNFYIKVATNRL